ncbi:MAG: D-2-hydroxyacid dehydrogenase [Pseudomonadota bacterium]
MTQRPLRILLSPAVRQELAPAIAQVMGGGPYELVSTGTAAEAAQAGVDIAFISRDVTGLSTKHELTQGLQDFYALLRRSEGLRWVHIHSAGADRPIYPELRARGVQVSTSSGANAEVVAQTALAGLLALARRFPQLMAAQQARRWAPLVGAGQAPRDLAGQTAVIVGWGPIGRRIAAFLRLLGLHLVVARHSASPAPEEGVEMVALTQLGTVLPRADWLVLACPLTPQTRALVDARMLALLPAGACLLNVARGEVVVEGDVIAALQRGQLGGAYLDVFEHEPLDTASPLWALPQVIVTPHSAGHSDGNHRRVCELFLANLQRWQAGQPLRHVSS